MSTPTPLPVHTIGEDGYCVGDCEHPNHFYTCALCKRDVPQGVVGRGSRRRVRRGVPRLARRR